MQLLKLHAQMYLFFFNFCKKEMPDDGSCELKHVALCDTVI